MLGKGFGMYHVCVLKQDKDHLRDYLDFTVDPLEPALGLRHQEVNAHVESHEESAKKEADV